LSFFDSRENVNYLECKTYNIENINTTQRSFYLSPSKNSKITKDAHHFLLSFEIFITKRIRRMNLYKCKSWKLISLEKLDVDIKYEFQSDNRRLYSSELVLVEGSF